MIETVFYFDLVINYILLMGALWSIVCPEKRIWPPPKKRSWQYAGTWVLFYSVFVLNIVLVIGDWNTWVVPDEIRFYIGVPVTIIGVLVLLWGIQTLGIKNTSGLRNGFITIGPYRYTRNPQYIGDIFLFTGISLVSNSLLVVVVHLITSIVLMCGPFTEELWLEKQYGEEYRNYKKHTARFL